jgi:molybdopterin converting factor small subunit
VTVRVPAQLRNVAGGQRAVLVDACPNAAGTVTVADVLAALRGPYPGVHDGALDEQGAVREHVNLFAGDENIRFAQGLATPVLPGSELWILPAVSGG